jgi:hypothetical protein
MQRQSALNSILALAALVVGLEPLLVQSLGSRAPGWSHWLCSAHHSASASHAVGGGWLGSSSLGGSWLGRALHTTFELLAVHWPHFLPIVLALGTLVYLWRADAAWRAEASRLSPGAGAVALAPAQHRG